MPVIPPPVSLFLVVACGVLLLLVFFLKQQINTLQSRLEEEESRQKSLSTTYGRITEQWFPLMPDYPYDPQHFRFLGTPIDGVQFEEDRIIFVEFKANRSRLSRRERTLRRLIEAGEVYWEEFRFADIEPEEDSEEVAS